MRLTWMPCWLTLGLLLNSCATKVLPLPEYKEIAIIGLQLQNENTVFDPPRMGKFAQGIRIDNVFPQTPAAKAGIEPGDFVLNQEKPEIFLAELGKLKVGQEVSLEVLKGVTVKTYSLKADVRPYAAGDTEYRKNISLWNINPVETALQKRIHTESTAEMNDLLYRFTKMSQRGDSLRPTALSFLQRHPFTIQEAQSALLSRLRNCKADLSCFENLQIAPSGFSTNRRIVRLEGKTARHHLRYIQKVLDTSDQMTAQAFAKLTVEDKKFLTRHILELSEKFKENTYVHSEYFVGQKKRYYELFRILQKVDFKALSESLFFKTQHLNLNYFSKLKQDLNSVSTKSIIIEEKTKSGVIVIAGREANNHERPRERTRLILDIGGDDVYRDIEGSIVDLAGNDNYESSLKWSLGGAFMTTSLMLDLEGNDSYECREGCLGASLLGASLFVDMKGDDRYRSGSYALGVGWSGLGLFMDAEGNDTYLSRDLSQGVGIAGGYGTLIDLKGDDSYVAQGTRPSSYGDRGQFEGWSQGVGIGLRFFVSGGVGILYDKSGKDIFKAGTFSQGGGYYFGWGALVNDGMDDDSYEGMRYAQGFSAHSAVGTFLEVGGNDHYANLGNVSNGIAWDLSLSLFEDMAGNDHYATSPQTLGAASHNSFAFFIDHKGKDTYAGKELPRSIALPNDYHGGKSLGFFLDAGSEKDHYERFKNNSSTVMPDVQIYTDE